MNIVKASAKLMNLETREEGIALLRRIEFAARVSHRSEDAQTDTSWERFLTAAVLGHGDWSVVEHASVSVDFLVDRGITHELVRHRLFSFTQESTRFVNYEKKMPASFIMPELKSEYTKGCWIDLMNAVESSYKAMIREGESPQIARSVLPNALASRIIVTGNLRSFRHLFLMRTTRECHPQMLEVMVPLLKVFQERIPLIYDDIIPGARQVENVGKAK